MPRAGRYSADEAAKLVKGDELWLRWNDPGNDGMAARRYGARCVLSAALVCPAAAAAAASAPAPSCCNRPCCCNHLCCRPCYCCCCCCC